MGGSRPPSVGASATAGPCPTSQRRSEPPDRYNPTAARCPARKESGIVSAWVPRARKKSVAVSDAWVPHAHREEGEDG
jgi:hypothetical protein